MIQFSTVIDNFDRVYKAKIQKEENLFLNSSLELVDDSSEKASFFHVIFALQFRKWDYSSENSNPSEISRSIKKISLQAKLIYDNDPFPAKLPCKYVDLLNKSICEGSFLNPAKLEEHAEEIRKYCETLYFYKLFIEAEERIIGISESDNLKFPPNLEEFNKSAEELFHKILILIQTKEFSFVTEAKYKDPLLYLSVFIEGNDKTIEKTYPEILQILQLAELAYSKNDLQPTKATFTVEQLRDKFLSILVNPLPKKIKQRNLKDKIFFMAGYSRSISPTFNDINKYKNELKLQIFQLENNIAFLEKELKVNERNINIAIEYKFDFSREINILRRCLKEMKHHLSKDNIAVLCFQELPFLQIQHSYIKSVKKLITTLKIEKLSFANSNFAKRKDRPLTKSKEEAAEVILAECKRVRIEASADEQKTVQEHFPTLTRELNYTNSQEKFSNLKLEITNAAKIYTLLMLELDKAHSVNPSLKEKTSLISPSYIDLLELLSGKNNPSLPSSEEFAKPTCLISFFSGFFSANEIKNIDELIRTFEKKTKENLETKIKEYSQEYLRLQSNKKSPIRRPKAVSKDSFVASTTKKNEPVKPSLTRLEKETKTQIETSTGAIQKNTITKPTVILSQSSSESTEEKEVIVPHQEKLKFLPVSSVVENSSDSEENIREEDTVDFLVVETGKKKKSIPKKKVLNSFSQQEDKLPPSNALAINSLKTLPLVTVEQKIPSIFYHDHVSRWFSRASEAVDDPKYSGFNVTNAQKREAIVYHAFPQLIDSLLETNYSIKKVEENSKEGMITRYGIPGTIILNTKKHHGIFEYTINDRNICFHRCFSRKCDNFEKIKPVTVSTDSPKKTKIEHFYFGKTPVEMNTKNREITITDYKTNTIFTIVHPDNYWKLPNKIITIS